MKKMLTALLCAILMGSFAFAESPSNDFPTPTPEAASAAFAGSMSGTFNGAPLTLDFDPDPQFSICQDGYVQASFYAYGKDDLLYELYMTFPQSVQSGDVVSPESSLLSGSIGSGLMLFVSDSTSDTCSAASQYISGPYPEGSSYTMNFSNVSANGTAHTFSGAIDAQLAVVDMSYTPTSEINTLRAEFSFTMNLDGASSEPGESRSAPEATLPPSDGQADPGDIPEAEPSAEPYEQRPPLPPTTLITPSDAQKI